MGKTEECRIFGKLRKDAQEYVSKREKSIQIFDHEMGRYEGLIQSDIKAKLETERRKARSGSPDYNTNRHINLLRILKSIQTRVVAPG